MRLFVEAIAVKLIFPFSMKFQSPTAMVLVNTSFVAENEFSAVVYDMYGDRFTANFSVFGIISSRRPALLGLIDFS